MGLLDYLNSPAGMGLLSAAAGYAAGARRGTPVNNIGRGMIAGMGGYSQGLEYQKQAEQEAARKAFGQKVAEWGQPQQAPTQYGVGGQVFNNATEARSAANRFALPNLPQGLPGLSMMQPQKEPMVNLADSGAQNEAGAPAAPDTFQPEPITEIPGQQKQRDPMALAQLLLSSDVPEYQQIGMKIYTELVTKQDTNKNFGPVMPHYYTPESLAQYQQTRNYSDLRPIKSNSGFGNVNPGQFTPDSLALYQETGNMADLVPLRAPTVVQRGGDVDIMDWGRDRTQTKPRTLAPDEAADITDRRRKLDYDLPKPRKAPQVFTVTDPNGGVHTFPSQEAANKFKRAIGGR